LRQKQERRKDGAPNPYAIQENALSKIRVAVPKGNTLKWLFPQEKATFEALIKGTFTLVLL
jgi:hypothetical protein